MDKPSNMEEFIKKTITEAGKTVLSYLGNAKVVHSKITVNDIVTEADLASQKLIVDAIHNHYPDHGIVSEESEDYNTDADYVWYIDPLDGTKNFESGVQLFGVIIAVTYKKKLKYAAMYMPLLNELCYAEEGKGAYLNDEKVSCSDKKDWLGLYGCGPMKLTDKNADFLKEIGVVSENTAWVNGLGCAIAPGIWVASGRRDFYLGTSSNSWDYAASALICKEAGCVVTNFNGGEWNPGDKGLVVANKYLHPKLIEIVQPIYS